MGPGSAAVQQGASGRFHADHLHRGVMFLQEFARPADRSAGTRRGHKDVHLSFRVLPDLRAGGPVVRQGVVGIAALAEDHGVLRFSEQLRGLRVGAAHVLRPGGMVDLRAEGPQEARALLGQIVRHADFDLVSLCGADRGDADAGIPGRSLDDRPAGFEFPGRFLPGNH